MTRFFFSILFSTVFIDLSAQVAIQLGQQSSFGGNNQEAVSKLIPHKNGGYLIVGNSKSGISGNKTTPNYGEDDIWLIKTNAMLAKEWELNYGGFESDLSPSVVSDSAGNIYLASWSYSGISGNKTSPLLGGNDFWLVKLTSSGDLIWQKSIGTDNGDSFSNILEKDGFIYLIGSSFGDTSAYKTEFSKGASDYWIIKLDSAGNRVWDKTIGSSENDFGFLLGSNMINNQIYLVGRSLGPVSGDKTEPSIGVWDTWVVKLDDSGNILWDRTLGGTSFENYAVSWPNANSLIVAVTSMSGVSGNRTVPLKGDQDCWLVELNENGDLIRQISIGGNGTELVNSIYKDSYGHYILVMTSNSGISGDKSESSRGGTDTWIVGLDENWNIVWQKTIGGSGNEEPRGIYEVSPGRYLVYGYCFNHSNPQDINVTHYGMSDYLVFELFTTVSIEESSSFPGIEIFPNPSSGLVNIRTSQAGTYRLQVINTSGQLLHDTRFSETVYQYDFSGLASGMYVIKLQTPDGKTASYKVIVDRDYK